MKRLLLSAAILALAACDRTSEQPVETGAETPETIESAADVVEVPISDAYPVGAPVRSIDFWSHPNVPFASLILVGTADGIIALNVETGAEVSRIEGFAADDIAVGYDGDQGYVAALDAEAGDLFVIDISNTDYSLTQMQSFEVEASSICLSRASVGKVFILSGNSSYWLDIRDGSESESRKIESNDEAAATFYDCLGGVDPEPSFFSHWNGRVYLGQIAKRRENLGMESELVNYALVTFARNSDSVIVAEQILGAEETKREFRFGASFDYPAVTSATALGAGYGNYGGVYRDGIVALGDENGKVSLVPWNSVVSALGLELGERVDPRNIYPEEDDPLAIEIDIVDPSGN